jgi:hypothetical protein
MASRVVVAEPRRLKREVMLFREGLLPSLLESGFGEELPLVFLLLYCNVVSKFVFKRRIIISKPCSILVLILYLR